MNLKRNEIIILIFIVGALGCNFALGPRNIRTGPDAYTTRLQAFMNFFSKFKLILYHQIIDISLLFHYKV